MALSEDELGEQLIEIGNRLLDPPASVNDTFYLLDNIDHLLMTVEQAPSRTIQDALLPPMKALISEALLRHSDSKVKISVASCLTEITRITAPEAPYGDDQMKEIFKLTIAAFEKLSDISSHSYRKAFSILDTVAKVRSCLVMLDLELDELIADMFRLFLRIISSDHPPNVYVAMEKIMALVIEESEDISLDLLHILLSSVRKDAQNLSPEARKLGADVITKCRAKLRPYFQEGVKFGFVVLDEHSLIVSSICEEECNNSAEAADYESGHEQNSTGVGRKLKMKPETDRRKRGQKSNFLMNPEEKSGRKPRDMKAVGRSPDVFPLSSKRNPSGGIHAKQGRAIKNESSADQDDDPRSLSPSRTEILGARSIERDNVSVVASLKRKSKERSRSEVKRQKQSRKHDSGEQTSQHPKMERNGKSHSTKSKIKGMDLSLVQTGEADEEHIADASNGKKVNSLKRRRSNSKESPKTESSKKCIKRKEMASEVPDPGELLIDKRIKVWWPMDKVFYNGVVTEYDPIKDKHTILYSDGDQEVLNLKKQRWELIEDLTLLKEEQGASVSKGKYSSDVSRDYNISKAKKGDRKKPTADAKERGPKAGSETVHKKYQFKSSAARVGAKQRKLGNLSRFVSPEASSEGTIDNPTAEVDAPKQSKSKPLSPSESGIDNLAAEVDSPKRRTPDHSGPSQSEEANPDRTTDAAAEAKTATSETGTPPDMTSAGPAGNEHGSGDGESSS